jgi:hypothetical protein
MTPTLREPASRDHLVQAYSDDAFLARVVTEYVATGLAEGEGAIVIATPFHVTAFMKHLTFHGISVRDAVEQERLLFFDAEDTLAKLQRNGMPEPSVFHSMIERSIGRVRRSGCSKTRCFGEMVDLLWAHDLAATLRLEELWNRVLARHDDVSLLCAYSCRRFDRTAERVLQRIVRCHSHLLPDEDQGRFDAAVNRAYEDIFGVDGEAAALRRLIVNRDASMPIMSEGQAALFALRDVSERLAAQVVERGSEYYYNHGARRRHRSG